MRGLQRSRHGVETRNLGRGKRVYGEERRR